MSFASYDSNLQWLRSGKGYITNLNLDIQSFLFRYQPNIQPSTQPQPQLSSSLHLFIQLQCQFVAGASWEPCLSLKHYGSWTSCPTGSGGQGFSPWGNEEIHRLAHYFCWYTQEDWHGTWEYTPGKGKTSSQTIIFRFYGNLRGCNALMWPMLDPYNVFFVDMHLCIPTLWRRGGLFLRIVLGLG